MNTDPAPLHENENENPHLFEKSQVFSKMMKAGRCLQKFAFGNQIPSLYQHLEPIGRKIVPSCDGVPSTVRTLGSLLRFKLQVADWKTVHRKLAPSQRSVHFHSFNFLFFTDFFLFSFNFQMTKLKVR